MLRNGAEAGQLYRGWTSNQTIGIELQQWENPIKLLVLKYNNGLSNQTIGTEIQHWGKSSQTIGIEIQQWDIQSNTWC